MGHREGRRRGQRGRRHRRRWREDDRSRPSSTTTRAIRNVASSNVDTLINKDGAIAILGPIVPTVGNAAALAAEKNGIPYLQTGNPIEPFIAVKADSGGWKYAFNFFVLAPPVAENAYKFPADLGIADQHEDLHQRRQQPGRSGVRPRRQGGRRGQRLDRSRGWRRIPLRDRVQQPHLQDQGVRRRLRGTSSATPRRSSRCASRWTRPATSPRSSTSSVAPSCRSSRTPPATSPTASPSRRTGCPPCRIRALPSSARRFEADTGTEGRPDRRPVRTQPAQIMMDAITAGDTTDQADRRRPRRHRRRRSCAARSSSTPITRLALQSRRHAVAERHVEHIWPEGEGAVPESSSRCRDRSCGPDELINPGGARPMPQQQRTDHRGPSGPGHRRSLRRRRPRVVAGVRRHAAHEPRPRRAHRPRRVPHVSALSALDRSSTRSSAILIVAPVVALIAYPLQR